MELVGDVLHSLPLERSRIAFVTIQAGHFGQDGLNQVTDSHTRGDGVRVDNHVGDDTLHCEGQVFLPIRHTASAFLSVPTGELVTDLGDLDGAHFDLD